jgi:hypothetical protein
VEPRGLEPDPQLDQVTVNGADTATSYGVVVFLFSWTTYEPGSTVGGPDALMSP